MDQVIIEFVADTKGLKLAADQLLALGKISKEQHAEFSKTNQEAEKQLKARAIFEKEISKATQQATNDAKKMNDSFRQLTATIAGEVIKETVQSFQELGRETEEVAKKFNSAKQELKALTAQINNGELEGDALTTAKLRAAELTDQIGDTRDEIRALASDTRTFDLMVEGVRGITAAMSLAQGATALFGEENEDVQKALLKVQAAMAVATATQELATIATTKGGLAQTAYSLVVGTSTGALKAFRIALAATGIGLAVVAVAALVENWDKLTAAVREYLGLQPQLTKEQVQEGIKRYESIKKIYNDEIELERSKGNDTKALELRRLNDLKSYLSQIGKSYQTSKDFVAFQLKEQQDILVKQTGIEKQLNGERLKNFSDLMKSQIKEMREQDAMLEEGVFMTEDHIQQFIDTYIKGQQSTDEPLITEETVDETEANAKRLAESLVLSVKDYKKIKESWEAVRDNLIQKTKNEIFAGFASVGSDAFALAIQSISAEGQALEEEKQKQLDIAGDNAEKRIAIEKKFATEQAKIRREQAIFEKVAATFSIATSTAQAVQQAITADAAVPAVIPPGIPNPAKAASTANMISSIAIATAGAILRTAAIAATPLPAVPGYEKGVRNAPEGFALVGEKGPELMWIPQGASIIPNAETREILDKWGVPSMPSVPPNYAGDNGNSKVAFDYRKMAKAFGEELRSTPHVSIRMDKTGFTTHVIQKGLRVQNLNNSYEA